jgi:uncharacterized membrane protein YfcA
MESLLLQLTIALGHLLDFTPVGWWIVVALVVVAFFAWILGSRIFTRWLLHKALVVLIVIMAVRSLARIFLNE